LSPLLRLIVDLSVAVPPRFYAEKFLIGFATMVIISLLPVSFISYLLCFEHVDNLGVYRIPSETGLLVPSVFIDRTRDARADINSHF